MSQTDEVTVFLDANFLQGPQQERMPKAGFAAPAARPDCDPSKATGRRAAGKWEGSEGLVMLGGNAPGCQASRQGRAAGAQDSLG